jgi:hypothetical protein
MARLERLAVAAVGVAVGVVLADMVALIPTAVVGHTVVAVNQPYVLMPQYVLFGPEVPDHFHQPVQETYK